jgi:hypothetical protein
MFSGGLHSRASCVHWRPTFHDALCSVVAYILGLQRTLGSVWNAAHERMRISEKRFLHNGFVTVVTSARPNSPSALSNTVAQKAGGMPFET